MANIGATNAEWLTFFREWLLTGVCPIRLLLEIRDRFGSNRVQARAVNDVAGNVDSAGGVSLTGVIPGVNSRDDGGFYVHVTGAGPYTVTFYKATGGGGGDAVCSGSGNANTQITLAESNGSGVSGTFDLESGPTVVTDDSFQVVTYTDFPEVARLVFDGTNEDHEHQRSVMNAAYAQVFANLDASIGALQEAVSSSLLGSGNNTVGRGNTFLLANETALQTDTEDPDNSGNVRRSRGGLFEEMAQAMADETTGSTQFVARRVVTAAQSVATSTNQGVGVIAAHTPQEKCQAGRLFLQCVDDTIGQETFDGYFAITDSERRTLVSGVQVGKIWSGPNGLGPLTLARTLAKTGDVGTNTDLGALTGFSITGETSANTDDGVLYWKVEANSSNWDVSFYSASTRSVSSLVAKAENVAAAASFTATAQNSSGLTVVGTVGSGPTTNTEGTLDLQVFKVQNTNGKRDSFNVTISATEEGKIQTMLAKLFSESGSQLESSTAGSATIPDDYARANTFAPFTEEDN